jgi:dsDNA-specific endonuclease/ATPase MutS2
VSDRADEDPDEDAAIELPLADSIDLHAFAPRDVGSVAAAYLDQAAEAGLREVRLIHGRGIGAQREIVRAVLARHAAVERFGDAGPDRGGWGATIAWLRPRV